jgi:hypothetical protein
MIRKRSFWFGMLAALAFGLVGCGDDAGGSGGTGGTDGTGGATTEMAMVTAVHLAPEVPSTESTEVAIFVDGADAGVTLSYGQTTGRIPLDAGTYAIGIGLPGEDGPLLELEGVELNGGDDLTVVAYRTNDILPVNLFVFSNGTDSPDMGNGRVFVGHGANDSALDPVNIATSNEDGTAECATLISSFAFGTTFPPDGVADLPAGTVNVGFDLTLEDEDACPQVGPVPVPVTADVVSILVAVDENITDGELDPELWGIVDADTLVRLIKTDLNP